MIVEVGDTLNSWLCMYIHGVTLCTHLVSEEDSTEDCEIRRVPRPPPPPPALALAVAAEAAECVMAVAAKSSWLRTLILGRRGAFQHVASESSLSYRRFNTVAGEWNNARTIFCS